MPGHISLSGVSLSLSRASASISTGQQIRQWVRLDNLFRLSYVDCRGLTRTMIHSKIGLGRQCSLTNTSLWVSFLSQKKLQKFSNQIIKL